MDGVNNRSLKIVVFIIGESKSVVPKKTEKTIICFCEMMQLKNKLFNNRVE